MANMTKPLKIPTRLGLNLAAVYHQPSTPGPYPLVILLHGFTGYKEEEHIATLAEALAYQGIAALRFDAPGSGESEGTWAEDYRVNKYVSAVGDVLEYAKTNLEIDPNLVAIWGHSMGGYIALATAAHSTDIKALVASQPSIGWMMVPEGKLSHWQGTGWAPFTFKTDTKIKLPYAFYDERRQYSSLKEAAHLKIPSLFIAGLNDIDVPAQKVREIYAAASGPKQYLEFSASHGYKHELENLSKINTATLEFFMKNLTRS